MQIDNFNIDQIVFGDKKLQKELSYFKGQFDQWLLGTKVPALRFLAQKSRLELLEGLNTHDNIAILEKYFNEKVSIQTIDYHVAQHHKIPIENAEMVLNEMKSFSNNISISRDAEYLYVSFWR